MVIKPVVSFLILLCILVHKPVSAQENIISDSSNFAFLPAIAYNSDFGLMGGGLANWYTYKNQSYPFYSYVSLSAIISTKGLASFEILHDKPNISETSKRLTSVIYVSRFFEDTYFGIGNYSKISDTPDDRPNYFLFKSFSAGFSSTLRVPVLRSKNSNRSLDVLAILNIDYETPWDNPSDRLITEATEQPTGYDGGITSMVGTGFRFEARNNEFRPTHGGYISSTLEIGSSLWGSDYNLTVLETELAHYKTFFLIKNITFAQRLSGRFTTGDAPYWKLSSAGDEESMRGYPTNRFLDDHLILLNNELRTWIFDVPSIDARFGGNLFMDVGRTFETGTSVTDWAQDLKYTFGFSAKASFFTPDFIIRADVGFSEEDLGVYVTTGYMF